MAAWVAWVPWTHGFVCCVGQILVWLVTVAWFIKFWCGLIKWRRWRGSELWRGWHEYINFWRGSKKKEVGRVFGVGYVGLRRFVKKALLNFSQNLEENICDGVSS